MEITDFLKVFAGAAFSDFARYFVFAGFAYVVFWVLLKKILSHRFIQRNFPKRTQLFREFGYSISSVLIFGMVGALVFVAKVNGYTLWYDDIDEYGTPYLIASIFAAILIHDTYFYWTHRIMHHPKLFKHVHLVHHKSTNPSPWAAFAFHPIEALVQVGIAPLLVFTLPLTDLSLLAFATYSIILNVFGHFSFELFPKGFTRNKWVRWHNTTTHHNMHHKFFNNNYSLYFNWWDRIGGTLNPKYDEVFDEVASRKRSSATDRLEKAPTSEQAA